MDVEPQMLKYGCCVDNVGFILQGGLLNIIRKITCFSLNIFENKCFILYSIISFNIKFFPIFILSKMFTLDLIFSKQCKFSF